MNKILPFVVFTFVCAFFVASFHPSFSQSIVQDNLPSVDRYARVGADSLPIVAPEGFILLAESAKATNYIWTKTDIISEEMASNYRIKDVFTCSLPCDSEIYSSKSPDGEYISLFTVTLEIGDVLEYIIGDIHRGETLVRNGEVVTPTVIESGDGWAKFKYVADHPGLFRVMHSETRFAFYRIIKANLIETPVNTPTVTPTVTIKPSVTPSPIVTPTIVFTLPTDVPVITLTPTPVRNNMILNGICLPEFKYISIEFVLSKEASVTVMRNNMHLTTFNGNVGGNQFIDQSPLIGENRYTITTTFSENDIMIDSFSCYISPPTNLPVGEEMMMKPNFLPITYR